jgi:alkanesulfonate monooxygenase SsuD/methylene tetrahydromethanopterin reductase-like flavin-dependent oxidoreductase (luciferase family)
MAIQNDKAPLFGANIDPSAHDIEQARSLARLADSVGLDLIGIQDHPYNPNFVDTWTLLTALGAITEHVKLFPNVLNLPLRPPAMLAKAAASLDLLTNGRVELGLGAGALWDGISAYGGPRRAPGEAVSALEEAIGIMRALWQPSNQGKPVEFPGKFYQIDGAQPGPAPAHEIRIWLGALGPRMLRVTGALADGWIVSAGYVPPERLPEMQRAINESAQAAGRELSAIRRGYNLAGVITDPGQTGLRAARPGIIAGPASRWIDEIARYHNELGMDTFIFWPAGDGKERQIRLFADEVVPSLRETLSNPIRS